MFLPSSTLVTKSADISRGRASGILINDILSIEQLLWPGGYVTVICLAQCLFCFCDPQDGSMFNFIPTDQQTNKVFLPTTEMIVDVFKEIECAQIQVMKTKSQSIIIIVSSTASLSYSVPISLTRSSHSLALSNFSQLDICCWPLISSYS